MSIAALMLFGLVDGGRLGNGVVAEALPTAASLVCVFDEPPMQDNSSSPASGSETTRRMSGATETKQ